MAASVARAAADAVWFFSMMMPQKSSKRLERILSARQPAGMKGVPTATPMRTTLAIMKYAPRMTASTTSVFTGQMSRAAPPMSPTAPVTPYRNLIALTPRSIIPNSSKQKGSMCRSPSSSMNSLMATPIDRS